MKVVPGRDPTQHVQLMSPTFTGTALGQPIVAPTDGVAVTSVVFTPGARTWWHRHERGQVLHVTGGTGWVGSRAEPAARIRVGDTVWAEPGEEHWHGAGEDSFLLHTAVSLGATDWLEEVSPEDGPPAAPGT